MAYFRLTSDITIKIFCLLIRQSDYKKIRKQKTENKTMKQLSIIILFIIFSLPALAKIVTLNGYLKDKANGEALIGASVSVPQLKTGVVTNSYGYYSLSFEQGSYSVSFSYMGYQTQTLQIDLTVSKQVNVMLMEDPKQLDEVVVKGEKKNQNVEKLQMSMERVQVKMLKKLPSFMGEVDILKSITLLPGIQNGGEGSSGLYVRGGGPDENLMILDEAPVYNASHLMGFFSVFNSDAIKDVDVYKGGIPAEYGGGGPSVIDIRLDPKGTRPKYHHAQ